MKFEYPTGATPLNLDEANDLIPLHIGKQHELNEWEAANILEAENWLFSTRHRGNFLTIDFVKKVHKKMFDKTWKWAGTFRNTERNIGVNPSNITTELKKLLDDTAFHITNNTYSIDEIAYRFHHRLVWIHPFPNGNGRHSRMMTDFLLVKTGHPPFSWGTKKLEKEGAMRLQYIAALQNADKQNYKELAAFVRS